ncbi:integrator complex subunit 12-like [Venturia canescens]|uniref:integrator complex subunit 12-like n=1 Tax=Venturia canescens TaxID=32260 RepID=UPI001C9BFF95|nr:integrator complex subunit 12-like [Venturia canescens]
MYSDIEVVKKMNGIFVSALGLLHSRDIDSAEKLKRMLNSLIEKESSSVSDRERQSRLKHSLTDRKTETFVDNVVQSIPRNARRIDVYDHRCGKIHLVNPRQRETTDYESITACDIELEHEDQFPDENIDVPRISIPEENSDDVRVVCKICKGDKLGPLILLECQECQETYHPLCHQPAVIEIDVYDPRLVWRCGKCLETTNRAHGHLLNDTSSFVMTLGGDDDDNDDDGDDDGNEGENVTDDVFRNTRTRMTFDTIDNKGTTRSRNSVRRRTRSKIQHSRKVTTKNTLVQLRKRVGTKLTVNRSSPS